MNAWLRLLRASNLPTVWSSVLVPFAFIGGPSARIDLPWAVTGLLVSLVSASCLYLAGMVLNDVFDVDIDQEERPERPIPSGAVSRRNATIVGVALLTLGGLLPFICGWIPGVVACSIGGMVLLYDLTHARTARSTILMGLCRGGVYLLGVLCLMKASDWHDEVMLALIIAVPPTLHVIAFSMIAREETGGPIANVCPSCGYEVGQDSLRCSECGGVCDLETRRARQAVQTGIRHSWWGTMTLFLLAPFVFVMLLNLVFTINKTTFVAEDAVRIVGSLLCSVCLGFALVRATRHLHRHPAAVGRFVLRSIRNISLYDACIGFTFFTMTGSLSDYRGLLVAGIALLCFYATLRSHRRIPGT